MFPGMGPPLPLWATRSSGGERSRALLLPYSALSLAGTAGGSVGMPYEQSETGLLREH